MTRDKEEARKARAVDADAARGRHWTCALLLERGGSHAADQGQAHCAGLGHDGKQGVEGRLRSGVPVRRLDVAAIPIATNHAAQPRDRIRDEASAWARAAGLGCCRSGGSSGKTLAFCRLGSLGRRRSRERRRGSSATARRSGRGGGAAGARDEAAQGDAGVPSEPVVAGRPSAEVEPRDEGVVYGGARGICSSD